MSGGAMRPVNRQPHPPLVSFILSASALAWGSKSAGGKKKSNPRAARSGTQLVTFWSRGTRAVQ